MGRPGSSRRPYWLWQTQRLFPHPLFAGLISLASFTVAFLFAGVALHVSGCWPMAFPSALFFAGACATAVAAVVPREAKPAAAKAEEPKPTFAIVVLLIGVYTLFLTLATHVFDAFLRIQPGSPKYYLNLGIAIVAMGFMQLRGHRIIRQHFGARGGRNLELSGKQAVCVVIVVVAFGVYGTWLVL